MLRGRHLHLQSIVYGPWVAKEALGAAQIQNHLGWCVIIFHNQLCHVTCQRWHLTTRQLTKSSARDENGAGEEKRAKLWRKLRKISHASKAKSTTVHVVPYSVTPKHSVENAAYPKKTITGNVLSRIWKKSNRENPQEQFKHCISPFKPRQRPSRRPITKVNTAAAPDARDQYPSRRRQ